MEKVQFNGWEGSVRLSDGSVELIVTTAIGPRISRFGFAGERNVFGEIPGQQGTAGESEWMIRGGHRLWIAPEDPVLSYELDNSPVRVEEIEGGIRTSQNAGAASGIRKEMDISMGPDGSVTVLHRLANDGSKTLRAAPWALTVMAQRGMAVIPLPGKIPHTERLTHNQEMSIWAYTDFADPRWTFGTNFILFRQDPARGPNKIGLAHRVGWVGYLLDEYLFIKEFEWVDGAEYPDGGVNFETFSNEDILELESLAPLSDIAPGSEATHVERWRLVRGVAPCATEEDVRRAVAPFVR